jgi:hypothetical protein
MNKAQIEAAMNQANAEWTAAVRRERTAQRWLSVHRWIFLPLAFIAGVIVGAWL